MTPTQLMGMPGAVADSGSTNQLFPPASAQEMPRQEEGFLAGEEPM